MSILVKGAMKMKGKPVLRKFGAGIMPDFAVG
jgi:hypothetical protein